METNALAKDDHKAERPDAASSEKRWLSWLWLAVVVWVSADITLAIAGTSPSTAVCSMAAQYTPGDPLAVTILIIPATSIVAYAVEEQPPAGWAVTGINEGGLYDGVNGKVKWGLFTDNNARTLTYQVTPPATASGIVTFQGSANFDGLITLPITGRRQIDSAPVIGPPVITQQPVSTTNNVGDTVTFSVTASGMLPLSYQWRKNGAHLSNGGNVSGVSTPTLTFADVQITDAGTYSVVITNIAGAISSLAADLTVTHVSSVVSAAQKTGPAGFGKSGFIGLNGSLAYRIDFENGTNASAPAQQVAITDQLSDNLDWGSFRLAEVGFGNQLIVLPANTAHVETNIPLSMFGTAFEVQIEAGLRSASGQAYAIFRSIDPATSLPPSVNIGFLPPEDGTGRGMGHVSFTVNAKAGLSSGTQIRNVALISFDNQPAVATNQRDPHNPGAGTDPAKECLNTIDAVAPTSEIVVIPDLPMGNSRVISWTGQDDAGGSGIANYTIFVAKQGEPWQVWLLNTTKAASTFIAEAGGTFWFRSVATDNVGNTELDSGLPGAIVAFSTSPQLFSVTGLQANSSGFVVSFNSPLDSARLNLYDVQNNAIGPPDLIMSGLKSGRITGSLIPLPSQNRIAFIKSGGPLAPDTYTVTLRSETNGFRSTNGQLLDGNQDGSPGDDYIRSFTVEQTIARVLSMPDFARGPGQPVNVPVKSSGIPITINDATGVQKVEFDLEYQPWLLKEEGVSVEPDLTPGWALSQSNSWFLPQGIESDQQHQPMARLSISLILKEPLTAGPRTLLRLHASVPPDASYGDLGILDLKNVRVNEGAFPVEGGIAVHLVAYFGDTTGDRAYTAEDVKAVVHALLGFDIGFAAYATVDPLIVADLDGNGGLNSVDLQGIVNKSEGVCVSWIPLLPTEIPELVIMRTTDQVILQWPANPECLFLEQSSALGRQPDWQQVTNAPTIEGDFKSLRIHPDEVMRFYRLRQ